MPVSGKHIQRREVLWIFHIVLHIQYLRNRPLICDHSLIQCAVIHSKSGIFTFLGGEDNGEVPRRRDWLDNTGSQHLVHLVPHNFIMLRVHAMRLVVYGVLVC